MEPIHRQVIILGGGPAGLAAAAALKERGVHDVLLLEREPRLGGILNQCIHDGFGLTRFGESLTGPEYARRFADRVAALGVETRCGCTVVSLSPQREILAAAPGQLVRLTADAVVLAMGCRERPRGALSIPGDRPSGVYTAGAVQAAMNLHNVKPGREAVILGSGDVGLILARRLTLEGIRVKAVVERQPYPGGLPRNVAQCLDDFDIPLYLNHTITRINGRPRLESVTVSRVDETHTPIPGTEQIWPCDTLILSAGLIPDNALSLQAGVALDPRTGGAVTDEHYQTSVPGIFAAGNVLQVHDLADFVSLEAEQLAASVARHLQATLPDCPIPVEADETLSHVLPQRISGQQDVTLSLRPRAPLTNGAFRVLQDGVCIAQQRFTRALPAVMVRIPVKASAFVSQSPVKVVSSYDENPDLHSVSQRL